MRVGCFGWLASRPRLVLFSLLISLFSVNAYASSDINRACVLPKVSVVSVLDYGAKPGDNHDDSGSIQKALDCASLKLKRYRDVSVFFPPGSYVVNRPLRIRALGIGQKSQKSLTIWGYSKDVVKLIAGHGLNSRSALLRIDQAGLKQLTIMGLGFITEKNVVHSAVEVWETDRANYTKLHLEGLKIHPIETFAGSPVSHLRFEYNIKVIGFRETYARDLHLWGVYDRRMHDFGMFEGEACLFVRDTQGFRLTDSSCHFTKIGLDIVSDKKEVVAQNNHSYGVKVLKAFKIRAGTGDVKIENTHSNSVYRSIEVLSANNVMIRDNHFLHEDYLEDVCAKPLQYARLYNADIGVQNSNEVLILNNSFKYPNVPINCEGKSLPNRLVRVNSGRVSVIVGPNNKKVKIV